MVASSHQKGNSPHFFKIILHDTLQNGKLGIPTKFVRKYGNGISSPAFLRVPTGPVWKVELIKSDGKIWLENGWQEFSDHYSLELGHLVVFGYKGKSNFQVMIFDKSTSEIEYPYTSNPNNNGIHEELLQQNIGESEDDASVQILEGISSSRKAREKPELPSFRPYKMARSSNSAVKTESDVKSEFPVPQVGHNGYPNRRGDRSRQVKADKKLKALERATRAFKSENPFFLVVMQPSYVGISKTCAVAIPTNFVRKHLMKEHCHGILCNSNGKTWTFKFYRKGSGKKLSVSIQTGWETFVQDNNIQVGDVCAFELINRIEISFKVVIYQGQNANCHQSFTSTDVSHPVKRGAKASYQRRGSLDSLNAHQKAKALQLASAFISANPYFVVVMQPSYVRTSKLNVPDNFARKYFKNKYTDAILVLSNGKSWSVRFYQDTSESSRAKLFSGWRRFALDNNLEVGDVCIFELIEGTQTPLKVTIYKKQTVEDENLGSSLSDKSRENQVELPESSVIKIELDSENDKGDMSSLQNQHPTEEFAAPKMKENKSNSSGVLSDLQNQCPRQGCLGSLDTRKKTKALQLASSFRSENPYFVVALQPSYVHTGQLWVSDNFARKYFKNKYTDVILVLSNGKSWPARFYQDTSEGSKAKLCSGWRRFVLDNDLEVGDVCVFELTEGTQTSIKVTIYKKQAVEDANLGSSLSDKRWENQVELQESSVIKIESDSENDKGDMSSLQNQHPTEEFAAPKMEENKSNASGVLSDLQNQCPRQGCLGSLNTRKKSKAFQVASSFRSANPYFVVALQPSYVHTGQLRVSDNFARKYFKNKHTDVILVLSNGKSWPARLCQENSKRSKLCSGWRRFVLDNDLEVGDVCVFELTEGTPTSLKVTIYKKQVVEDANLGSSLSDKSRENQVELRESSVVIKIELDSENDKGDMSILQNQHPTEELPEPKMKDNNSNASGEILDDSLVSQNTQKEKPASRSEVLEEAKQKLSDSTRD